MSAGSDRAKYFLACGLEGFEVSSDRDWVRKLLANVDPIFFLSANAGKLNNKSAR